MRSVCSGMGARLGAFPSPGDAVRPGAVAGPRRSARPWLSPSTTVRTRNTRRGLPRFCRRKGCRRRSSASDSASSDIRRWPPPSTGPGTRLENHSFSHGTGRDLFQTERLRTDLQRCQEVIVGITSKAPRYYRPAVGIRNPVVHRAARAVGLQIITWTQAARDGALCLRSAEGRANGRAGRRPGASWRCTTARPPSARRLARRNGPEPPRAASPLEGPRISLLDPGGAAHCSLTTAARVFSASRTKGLFLSVT